MATLNPSFGPKFPVLALLCGVFATLQASAGVSLDLMASVGDSLTAGFLSDWRAAPEGYEPAIEPAPSVTLDQAWPEEDPQNTSFPEHPRHRSGPKMLRLAQAFNEKYSLSWSSGFNLESHYIRLAEHLKTKESGTELEIYNVAMSGSVSADLPWQAQKIVDEWNRGIYRSVRYITVTIGANDTCAQWTPGGNTDNEVRYYVRKFFKTLSAIKQRHPIRVLISSIPKIPDLGRGDILNHYLTDKKTCRHRMTVRDEHCNSLIVWKTPEGYLQRVRVVARKNHVLKRMAEEANQKYGTQFQVMVGNSIFNQQIKLSHLSKDCFHPNAEGQAEFSRLLWDEQPWFK